MFSRFDIIFLFQLCHIDPGIAHAEELEQLKTLDSIFLEF